ncbi:MAG: hypothetical protein J6S29_00530 [Methanosphaera sp.]|nr:hypothetical protein [Methanosphaera sp.]
MDYKKVILLAAIITVVLAGSACASKLDYIGGANPETGIEIAGIEFNIPDGYLKNDSKSIVNQSNSTGDDSFVVNQETFVNVNGEEIVITIVDFDEFDVDAQMLHRICEGVDEKTLMGYPGYISDNNASVQFTYAYDNRAVSITASCEELINQVLVVEDA